MIDFRWEPPRQKGSLTVFPLLSESRSIRLYELLSDAIGAGTLRVTELGEGSVPELLAINEGERDVLVLDGEQLIGAKQNRMMSRSVILPAGRKTRLPVNCIERGRWHFTNGEEFLGAPRHSPVRVRRHNRDLEAQHVARGEAAGADLLREAQGSVWCEIDLHATDVGAGSNTDALDEIIDRSGDDIEAWQAAFPAAPDQVGLLAFVGSEPLGVDVVMDPELYIRFHPRLIAGYVQDALARPDGTAAFEPDAPEAFLKRIGTARRTEAPSVGRGRYWVLSEQVVGGVLEDGDRVVHLSAFPSST